MGAKARVLPGFLDGVFDDLLRPGQTVLDLFSGSGTVAAFCARRQRVVANDVQRYAWLIARSLIERPPGGGEAFAGELSVDRDLLPSYGENRLRLEKIYAEPLERERAILGEYAAGPTEGGAARLAAKYRAFLHQPGGLYGFPCPGRGLYRRAARLLAEDSISGYRSNPRLRPACLVTAYFANVYYGLRQAIGLDSLRAAIDDLPLDGPVAERKRVHYLSALLHTASVTTSGTSHFAQPRTLRKESELSAMARRRRIDVLGTFRGYSEEIAGTVAAIDLDPGNLCRCADYRELLVENGQGPSWKPEIRADLVYVDPPYTADNYSRFYHVLETLASYDYPHLERGAAGRPTAGRYPAIEKRFQSSFCRRGQVEGEFERVIRASAASGADLILSYGSPNGLLLKVYRERWRSRDPVSALASLCRVRYAEVETARRALLHSGQGDKNVASEELLIICRRPR